MSPILLFLEELRFRRWSFFLAVIAAALVAASLLGTRAFLAAHDRQTEELLDGVRERAEKRMAGLRDDARMFSRNLGFNILILPPDQDEATFYTKNRSDHFFTAEQINALKRMRFEFINHVLPMLRDTYFWPEYGGEVVLVGIEGQIFIKDPSFQTPMQEEIATGTIHIGSNIAHRLGLEPGKVVEMGQKKFTVTRLLPQKGNADDIAVLMNLADMQALTGKDGLFSGLLALSCNCQVGEVDPIRRELAPVLQNANVIEFSVIAGAREQARKSVAARAAEQMEDLKASRQALRKERELASQLLAGVISLCSLALLTALMFSNANARRVEAAMLRALGIRSPTLFALFLGKALLAGFAGGIFGSLAVFAVARIGWGISVPVTEVQLISVIAAAMGAAFIATLLPAWQTSRTDPAKILNQE